MRLRALVPTLLVLLSAPRSAAGQSIFTVAGGGSDDGRAATSAALAYPQAAVYDTAGNLYIADAENHRVRRVDRATRLISTLAGTGAVGYAGDGRPAWGATLARPSGLAFDRSGNLYVADTDNNRIRRVRAGTGVIETVAGTGEWGFSGDGGPARSATFAVPTALALDADGNLLVCDVENNRVRKVDLGTFVVTTVAGNGAASSTGDGGPAASASLHTPAALAVAASGDLYVAEGGGNRVRRVARATGVISTVAGTGTAGFSGDGGPATSAQLDAPLGLALDPSGGLFVADTFNARIRRIAPGSGVISTFAGNGDSGFSGDGGPAAAAGMSPRSLATDPDGTGLVVVEDSGNRVRRISFDTTVIFTVAGNGQYGFLGDLGPATSAALRMPFGTAVGPDGDLYVTDTENQRIRRVRRDDRTISTYAGGGEDVDGGAAETARLVYPSGIAFDSSGNLLIAEIPLGTVRKVDRSTGLIRVVAGGGSQLGDGGPATAARLLSPWSLAADRSGSFFVAEREGYRVRRVDSSGVITTVAGTGTEGYDGDGGAATLARIGAPRGLALDASGNLYVSTDDGRIRRVESGTGRITTYAGGGSATGDGGPATQAHLEYPAGISSDAAGNLFVAESGGQRIRRIDAATRVITTVAGTEIIGFYGDGGPAADAGLTYPEGVTVDPSGNLYVADTYANRIRAVLACVTVPAPALASPQPGAATAGTGAYLSWNAAKGAFRYDVYLDTVNPPLRKVAENVVDTLYAVANLDAGTTYYWAVEAKGDPYCTPVSTARSEVRSFSTPGACTAPAGLALAAPADAATGVSLAPVFSWQAATGAGLFDLYLGTSSPPPLAKAGIAAASFDMAANGLPPLLPGTTYYWSVVAHASCDKTKTSASGVRSFRTAGACAPPGAFSLGAPADGAAGVPSAATFWWTTSANASAYDLYLGTDPVPPLYQADLVATATVVSGLKPGATYRWRVVARSTCTGGGREETAVRSFTVSGDCSAPPTPTIAFTPGSVSAGQTYVVTWKTPAAIGPDDAFLVERSTSSSFSTILDRQATRAAKASFLARSPGVIWHRVRAVAGCGTGVASAPSAPVSVTVVAGPPNVVFSVPPQATVLGVGDRLEDARARFTLENIGAQTVSAILGKAEISSVPFFSVVDPSGGDAVFVSLEPRKPRTFEIRFSGPSNARPGAYQGIVFLAAQGAGLAVTPYAFVNLKVGASESAAPQILVGGEPSEYAYFDGISGDDSARTPLTIGIRNPGTLPMELGGEVGPEVWLVPEPGWNAQPIPPGATRTVRLATKRANAPNGSAFPRYTYFTVRTRSGASARLLVQDNDRPATLGGRTAPLGRDAASYIVPSVVRGTSAIGNTFVSRLLLSNSGSDPVQADLLYTPTEADGWDLGRVRRATVVVPPNDVVALTDPLVQLFGLTPPAVGALEVRAAAEKIGFLTVTSTVDAPSAKGGTFGFQLPTFERGEGARRGTPQSIPGIVATSALRTNLILVETTGVDGARVKVTLSDRDGNVIGFERVDVPAYGHRQLSGVAGRLGAPGGVLALGRLDLEVEAGSGAVASLVTQIDNTTDDAVTFTGRSAPATASAAVARLLLPGGPKAALAADPLPVKSVIPAVVNGYRTFPGTDAPWTFQSLIGFTSLSSAAATFQLTYKDLASGKTHVKSVVVPGRQTVEHANVLEQLFGLPKGEPSQGPVFVDSTPNGLLYAKVFSVTDTGTLGDSFPVVPVPGESLTGAASLASLYVDGLEQSVTAGVGTRSNLILNEVTGKPAKVLVRLYEAANRTSPVAEATVELAPFEKRQLSTVFRELGLDSEERKKDRTNVQCVVTADEASPGLVSAVVTKIDNKTGDTKNLLLTPVGGVPPGTGVTIGF